MENQIILGDCLEVMKKMPDNSVDCVITDPPYGINADKGVGGFGSSKETAKKYEDNWDNFTPTQEYFNELLRLSKKVIVFGGNYFTDKLPMNGHWIVWDKVGEMKFKNPFSDAELCWTNIDKKTVKKYIVIQQGFVSKEKERFHPTQKPKELIRMMLEDYTNKGDLILDPFLGSGTTAVACVQTDRRYIGIEKEEKYYNIAVKRVKEEESKLKLF